MHTIRYAVSCSFIGAALVVGAAGCSNDFLEVSNPNVIDASEVDPASSAATLAASTQQNFATAYGTFIQFSSHFTGETYIMETSGAQNEYGRREVSELNGQNPVMWRDMQLAVASGEAAAGPNAAGTDDKHQYRARSDVQSLRNVVSWLGVLHRHDIVGARGQQQRDARLGDLLVHQGDSRWARPTLPQLV